jgi:hypothetical protein
MLPTRLILPTIALLLSCTSDKDTEDTQHSDDDTQDELEDQIQIAGDLTSSELADHCAQYRRVDVGGSVTLDDEASTDLSAVDCIGSVSGDLVIQGDALTEISLSTLEFVGGDFLVSELPSLLALSVDNLETVEGAINIIDNPALQTASWGEICDVGLSIVVINNAQLTTLNLASLMTVNHTQATGRSSGSDDLGVEVKSNDSLTFLELGALTTLVGPLTIASNASLARVEMNLIQTIGGPVTVSHNPSLDTIGLDGLKTIAGNLTLMENPVLQPSNSSQQDGGGVSDFPLLGQVSGGVFLQGLAMYDIIYFPNLETITEGLEIEAVGADGTSDWDAGILSFRTLTSLGEDLSIKMVPAETLNFDSLASIPGDVTISDNMNLTTISFPENTSWLGHVQLQNNASLTELTSLGLLESIGGSLEIRENRALAEVHTLGDVNTIGERLGDMPARGKSEACPMSLLFCDNPTIPIETICDMVDVNIDMFSEEVYIYTGDTACPTDCPTEEYRFTEVCAGYCD